MKKTNDLSILFNETMLKNSTEKVMKQANVEMIKLMIRDLEKK
jgi:hypothetical protein